MLSPPLVIPANCLQLPQAIILAPCLSMARPVPLRSIIRSMTPNPRKKKRERSPEKGEQVCVLHVCVRSCMRGELKGKG
ncbi:hypothetical protein BS50DRAFT_181230 [Corynespora cassiicola Philippines]|uniref:Uncharacterized protein n=1 Tax=Corynespora cassiicola Philippines TaxID=1448308 RepID=A0A2T2P678_CORCC|nr:hypothetical protein BS50DRAFT_181230 [Corynespora cassiicola Philippines]